MVQASTSNLKLILVWIVAHIGAYMLAIPATAILIGLSPWLGVPLGILGTIGLAALAQSVALRVRFAHLAVSKWVGLSVAAFLLGLAVAALLTVVVAVCYGVTRIGSRGDYLPYAASQFLVPIVFVHTIVSVLILWGVVAHVQWRILKPLVHAGKTMWYASYIVGNTLAIALTWLLMIYLIRGNQQTSGPLDFTLLTFPSFVLLGALLGMIAGIATGVGLLFTLRPPRAQSLRIPS